MSRKAMEAKKSAPRVQADSMRLDKYLKVSRIIKRRSVANDACSTGHITVNGKEAKPGTDITFTVSKMDRFGNMVETHRETVTVGSMGLFSETLPLSRGNNYISFAAEGEAKTTTVIKQVPQQVKSQLQRMIALPGMGAKK